jgi:hypothetical protein
MIFFLPQEKYFRVIRPDVPEFWITNPAFWGDGVESALGFKIFVQINFEKCYIKYVIYVLITMISQNQEKWISVNIWEFFWRGGQLFCFEIYTFVVSSCDRALFRSQTVLADSYVLPFSLPASFNQNFVNPLICRLNSSIWRLLLFLFLVAFLLNF